MIIVAAFALNVAHPGPVFAGQEKKAKAQQLATPDPEAEVGAETKPEAVQAVSET